MSKIINFTDLIAWQEAHKVVLSLYKATEQFPNKEIYGLTSQMRRAAISLTSNIAEGFSRKSSKEKIQFYAITLGSNTELQNQLMLARDLGYIPPEQFHSIFQDIIRVHKLTNGLIRGLREA
ncbi:MAG: four helix bundle protein [Patescibacteria group bacterium]